MSGSLKNKTVLITGASSGIGEQTAYQTAKKGANLILCARRQEKLEEVKTVCENLGAGDVLTWSVNIADPDSIDALLTFLKERKRPIDVLVNNAGFGHSQPFMELDFQIVQELFAVNVIGLMYLTQQMALLMLEQPAGQIINVASLAGKVSTPNYTAYGATKGAVISFSNALRLELKPFNIQVTTVNFGPVNTPFFDRIESSRRESAEKNPFTLTAPAAGEIITNAIGTKKREVNRPLVLAMGAKVYDFLPAIGDYLLTQYFKN